MSWDLLEGWIGTLGLFELEWRSSKEQKITRNAEI